MNTKTTTLQFLLMLLAMNVFSGLAAAQKMGYAWANDPTSSSYTPSETYSYNSTGDMITITRNRAGNYTVRFASLTDSTLGGNVQATAYGGGSETCKVANWGPNGTNLDVNVVCFTASGRPVDTQYTVRAVFGSIAHKSAYVWGNDPTTGFYTPSESYAFNSSRGAISIKRAGVGDYLVRLPEMASKTSGGNLQANAYGTGSETCKVVHWVEDGKDLEARVRCFSVTGNPIDARYSVRAQIGSPKRLGGYVWANDPSSDNYTPSALYAHNAANGAISINRTGIGNYNVRFVNLGGHSSGGNVQVNAYGDGNETCKIVAWGNSGQDLVTNVRCFRPGGAPANTQYSVSVTK